MKVKIVTGHYPKEFEDNCEKLLKSMKEIGNKPTSIKYSCVPLATVHENVDDFATTSDTNEFFYSALIVFDYDPQTELF